jgi:hypothetical protein
LGDTLDSIIWHIDIVYKGIRLHGEGFFIGPPRTYKERLDVFMFDKGGGKYGFER